MPIDELGLVERLQADVSQLRKMQEQARFGGDHTYVRVANPEFLMSDLTQAAAAIERLLAERDEARRQFWLELREPGCVPERKGPWPHHMTAMTLREFMAARPEAFITVISFVDGAPLLQDGPECLQMLDGRSMGVGRRHIQSSKAAHARQALEDSP